MDEYDTVDPKPLADTLIELARLEGGAALEYPTGRIAQQVYDYLRGQSEFFPDLSGSVVTLVP